MTWVTRSLCSQLQLELVRSEREKELARRDEILGGLRKTELQLFSATWRANRVHLGRYLRTAAAPPPKNVTTVRQNPVTAVAECVRLQTRF